MVPKPLPDYIKARLEKQGIDRSDDLKAHFYGVIEDHIRYALDEDYYAHPDAKTNMIENTVEKLYACFVSSLISEIDRLKTEGPTEFLQEVTNVALKNNPLAVVNRNIQSHASAATATNQLEKRLPPCLAKKIVESAFPVKYVTKHANAKGGTKNKKLK